MRGKCYFHPGVSQLLKELETCFWAQNDRNGRVYISTYNNSKLYGLPFSRKSRKTVIVCIRDCRKTINW